MPRARTRGRGKNFITPEIMISERPEEADDRMVPGHWEGDLILGLDSSAIGTLVERTTRFTLLLHLPHMDGHRSGPRAKNGPALAGHGAEAVRDAIAEAISMLPEQLRRSLTWDQGAEMAQHVQLRIDTGLEAWFCDPVRHEAPCNRAVMKGHRRRLVAAGRRSWRQSDPGNAGEDGSSLDNAGTGQHCQMARVRQARREGVREEPVHKAPQEKTPARNLVDQGWFAVRTRTTSCGELLRRQRVAVGEATLKACGVGVAIPLGQSWAPHPSNGSW